MKPLHRRIEIDQPDRDATDARYRQLEFRTSILDQGSFGGVDIQRIEPDRLDLLQAEASSLTGLDKRGIDQTQLHCKISFNILFLLACQRPSVGVWLIFRPEIPCVG